MADRKQALQDLRDKVAACDGMGAGIIARIMASEARDAGRLFPAHDIHKAFYGSLDAALALHNAVLPEFGWSIYEEENGEFLSLVSHKAQPKNHAENWAATPARAWLLSIIEALISETPKGDTP